MNRSRFAHLSVRSVYSLREGAVRLDELASRTRALGMTSVAVTDTNGLYGAVRFAQACGRYGIKPVYGTRLTVAGEGGNRSVVTLLAKDNDGYTNLCRIITDAHMGGERGDPCGDIENVKQRADGIFLLLGPESDVGRHLALNHHDEALKATEKWMDAFGRSSTIIETRNLLEADSGIKMQRTLRLATSSGLEAVITNAVRAATPADAFLPDILDAMRKLVPIAEHHRELKNHEATLKSPQEMAALAKGRADLLENAWRIAEECNVDIGLGQLHLPEYPVPRNVTANGLLARRCHDGLARRNISGRQVRDRLDAELAMTARLGFAGYFLTVADIVRRMKAKNIRCACRGSAAGSLICYLLQISEVNPIEHRLLFERFVNPYRNELPDIDIDVASARREEVYQDILDAFPADQVGCVAMVDTYRARGAIREVGKALGYPGGEVDLVAKAFPHVGAGAIRDSLSHLPELKRTSLARGQLDLLFAVAERLDSFPRHLALHPSGILITPDDLTTRTPLERSANGFRMAQFDKDDVEAIGLLKLDVIGIRMLSSMTHALEEIQRTERKQIDLDKIPRDDEKTFEMVRRSDTLGCFQIESPGQRELLGKFQPDRWRDLIVDISLFRPGPVQSDMINPFLNRRLAYERPRFAHDALRPFLQESYGVIVYHEQVMQAIAVATGVDLGRADQIRRELADPDKLPAIEDWFFTTAANRGWDDPSIKAIWHEVASFAAFGFCKAHAAAFAVPTYQSAWLKANHPAAFYAGVLTHEPGMYPRRAIIDDVRHHNLEIHPLDVNRSDKHYTVEGDGIRIGLMHVDGINQKEIDEIVASRPYAGLDDLCRRTSLSRPTVEKLIHAGALEAFGQQRDLLLRMGDLWEHKAPKPAKAQGEIVAEEATIYGLRPYTQRERVEAELEVLGIDVTRHILDFYKQVLQRLNATRSDDLRKHRQDSRVMVAGVKVASQTPAVRSGQRIIFLTLDDSYGLVDVTVFESVQEQCAWTVFHSWLLVCRGTLRKTGARGVSINCERAWDLPVLASEMRKGSLDVAGMWTEGVIEIEAAEAERRKSRGKPAPAHGSLGQQVLPLERSAQAPAAPRKLWHASPGSAGA
jgi:error-prone DNA polymerase